MAGMRLGAIRAAKLLIDRHGAQDRAHAAQGAAESMQSGHQFAVEVSSDPIISAHASDGPDQIAVSLA